MQTENLFELTYILLEKKQVTASDMAKHFGVSQRTIYRWVDALNLAGVPVFAVKGKGGGIRVSEKYALDKTVFTEDEKQDLLSSIQAFQSLTGNNTSSAISKLKTLTSANINWIEIDFAPWNKKGEEIRNTFNLLKTGILSKRQVKFNYYSGTGFSKDRPVDPWKIVFRGQSWYLYGFCHKRNEPRFFKLNRMKELKILETSILKQSEDFPVPAAPDSDEITLEKFVLLVKPELVSLIIDEYSIEAEEDVLENGATWKKIILNLPKMNWLVGWFLSFGGNLKVLEPTDIANQIQLEVKKMYFN